MHRDREGGSRPGLKGDSTRLGSGQDLCCHSLPGGSGDVAASYPSPCLYLYHFFSLNGGGEGCGRTMNEVPSSSRKLWFHPAHHAEEGGTPFGLSGDHLQTVAAAAFPGIQTSSEHRTHSILAFPAGLQQNHSLALAFQGLLQAPRTTSAWGLGRRLGQRQGWLHNLQGPV